MNAEGKNVMSNGASSVCPVKPASVKVGGWWVLIVFSLSALVSFCQIVGRMISGNFIWCFVSVLGESATAIVPLAVGLNVRRGDNSARFVGVIAVIGFLVGMCFLDDAGFSLFSLMVCALLTCTPFILLFSPSANAWFRSMKEYRNSSHQVLHLACWKCLLYMLLLSIVSCVVEPIFRSAVRSAQGAALSPDRSDEMVEELQAAEKTFVRLIVGGEDKEVAIKTFTDIFERYDVSHDDLEAQKLLTYYMSFADFYVVVRDSCAEWNRTWDECMNNQLADEKSAYYIWKIESDADAVLDELLKVNGRFSSFIEDADQQLLEMGQARGQSFEANQTFRKDFFKKIRERLQLRVEYLGLMRKGRKVLHDASDGVASEADANAKLSAIGAKLTSIEEKLSIVPVNGDR